MCLNKYRILFLLMMFWLGRNSLEAHAWDIEPRQDSNAVKQLIFEAKSELRQDVKLAKMREAYLLSQKLGYQSGVIISLQELIKLHQRNADNIEAIRYCFSLIPILEKTKADSPYEYYLICGKLLVAEKLPSKAISYFEKALNIRTDQSLLKLLVNTAIAASDFKLATEYCSERMSIPISSEEKLSNLLQWAYCFQKLSNAPEALKKYQEALKLANEIGATSEANLALNNLGYLYFAQGNYLQAIEAFEGCLNTEVNRVKKRSVLINLAIAYQNTGSAQKCLKTLETALTMSEGDDELAEVHRLMASCYLNQSDTYHAMQYNAMAAKESKKSGNYHLIAEVYLNQSLIDQKLYDFEGAFENYRMYLYINDSLMNAALIQKNASANYKEGIDKSEKELKELALNDQIKYLTIQQLQLEKDMLQLESQNKNKEISKLKLEQENKQQQLIIIESEAARANQALAAKVLDQKINDLKQQDEQHRIELLRAQAEEKARAQEVSLLEQEGKINKLQLESQSTFRRNAYRYAILGGLLFLAIIIGLFFVRRKNKILGQQNTKIENQIHEINLQRNIIEAERLKSEQLLLNILPASVAAELKDRGEATPMQYEMVSVLFTDFVNFTKYAEQVSHSELVQELNTIFHSFDEIISKHRMEKIKTIGDSYMCAGGLPQANTTNAHDAVSAAIEMLEFTRKHNAKAASGKNLEIRIGVNTGRVVAGVIGKSKFAYDIWGDDVNIAARMEQSGESGKINISGSTYQYVKDQFKCSFRGMVDAKNKGKIEMYFVEGRI